MNLLTTGKFIAGERKAQGLTQIKLAEILNVSEKTISKWECGKGFPDTSLMLPLCNALNITANELLCGKRLSSSEYKTNAEQNLIELKDANEKNVKNLLTMECVVGYMASTLFIVLMFTASYFVNILAWQIALIVFGFVNFIIGIFFALKIEREAGFYVCGKCGHKYIPKFSQIFWSMHIGRTRYMRCPKCHKRSWNKKSTNNN